MNDCGTYGRPMIKMGMMMTLLRTRLGMEMEDDDRDGDGNVSRSVARFTGPDPSRSSCGRTSVPAVVDEGPWKKQKRNERRGKASEDKTTTEAIPKANDTTHHQAMKHRRAHCESVMQQAESTRGGRCAGDGYAEPKTREERGLAQEGSRVEGRGLARDVREVGGWQSPVLGEERNKRCRGV